MKEVHERFKGLPRMGDTGARAKGQIFFYSAVLEAMTRPEYKKDSYESYLMQEINRRTSINYKDKKTPKNNLNRISLILKVLSEFKLVNKGKNGKFEINQSGCSMFNKLLFEKHNLAKWSDVIFWQWCILNWSRSKDKNNTFAFRPLILELYNNKDKDDLGEFIIEWHLNKLRNREIPTNIRDFSIDSLKRFVKAQTPSKPPTWCTLEEMMNFFIGNRVGQPNNVEHTINGWKRKLSSSYAKYVFQYLFKSNKTKDVSAFLENTPNIAPAHLWNAINYAWNFGLAKDYLDLNLRWLFETKIINKAGEKVTVNSKLIELFQNQVYKNKNGLIDFEAFLGDIDWVMFDDEKSSYPHTFFNARKYLKSFEQEGDFLAVSTKVGLASPAAQVEYLVNLIFSYSLNVLPKNFRDNSRTKLDGFLLPTSHAPGGNADAIFSDLLYKENKYKIIVETTINPSKNIVDRELDPCQRHYVQNIEKNYKALMFLVVKKIDNNTIFSFMNNIKCTYHSENTKTAHVCKIFPLTFKELLSLSEKISKIQEKGRKEWLLSITDLIYESVPFLDENVEEVKKAREILLKKIIT